jgi:hypothetical protein
MSKPAFDRQRSGFALIANPSHHRDAAGGVKGAAAKPSRGTRDL